MGIQILTKKLSVMLKLTFSAVFAILMGNVISENCKDMEGEPFYGYSDSMGCVYAEPSNRYDTYDQALMHCKEIFGDKARLVEIHSQEDQDLVVSVMLEAEATITEDPEISYWFSGLRDDDDDSVWEWVNSGVATYFNCMQLLSATGSQGDWMTFLCNDDYINTHPLCQ